MKKLGLGLPVLTALFMASCAMVPYAREVKKRPNNGGTIALKTHHSAEDRAQADLLMKTNCGTNDVKVTEEGEAVVGQVTNTNSNTDYYHGNNGSKWGGVTFGAYNPGENTSARTETTQVKEWQIQYDCVASNHKNKDRVASKVKVKK